MNVSASQCSSGCESGWTHYLDQSSYSQSRYQNFSGNFVVYEEEQDLSMMSDASSGPRHYYQDYEECLEENGSFCSVPATPEPAKRSSKNKQKIKDHGSNQQHSYLDDTASSPVISFSKKSCKKEVSMDLLDFSQGFSGTHLKGKSAFHKNWFLEIWEKRFQRFRWFPVRKLGMTKRVNCHSFCL
ncbi:protein SOB FIVE-LIKE 6-like [Hibiscus syriacus]|uniref:protein SOB FIVE-LIKE 6-like n=1 Tax=Hibiscus syriacus TaxID=106335 RepID=UPI00192290C9|nr:protein SOB FIVE-LIKE 6-like [Hibiscus syriacus]